MGEDGLGRGRQSVAHGVDAAITDARAVDGSEVRVRLGRRQQAAGTAVPALGRERAEEGASGSGGDGVGEEGTVLACSPAGALVLSMPASKRSPSSSALSASPL